MISSKAGVALLNDLTTSKSELSALQFLTRLLAKDIKAHPELHINVHILGDSTCVISAISQAATFFNPYMHSRLLDIYLKLDLQKCNYALVLATNILNSEASHRVWSLFFEDAMPAPDLNSL